MSKKQEQATEQQIETLLRYGIPRIRAASFSRSDADTAIAQMEDGWNEEGVSTLDATDIPPQIKSKLDESLENAVTSTSKFDELEEELHQAIHGLVDDAVSERKGELSRNSYRLSKGGKLLRVDRIGRDIIRQAGSKFKSLSEVNDLVRSSFRTDLNDRGIMDAAKRLSPSEASIVKKAFQSWIGLNEAGLHLEFNLVDEVNPSTGQPLVADGGQPYRHPVSSIATNNLYYLADWVNPKNFDRLASIAWRYTEVECQLIGRALKHSPEKVTTIINGIATKRTKIRNEAGTEVQVNLDSVTLAQYLKLFLPKSATSKDVASVVVDRAFYEGGFKSIIEVATEFYRESGIQLNEKGEAPTTQVLERLLMPYLDNPQKIKDTLRQAEVG